MCCYSTALLLCLLACSLTYVQSSSVIYFRWVDEQLNASWWVSTDVRVQVKSIEDHART